jgi:transcriptional regulator with XRE-family HTH domain
MKSVGDVRLAETLRKLRLEKGLSRPELARRSGVSDITIYVAETRRRDLRISTIRALAEALEVPMGDLLD